MEFDTHRREELAWAAGFFDGEGSTHIETRMGRGANTDATYIRLYLDISQCTETEGSPPEVLVRFQKALLPIYSVIAGPYIRSHRHKNHRDIWRLRVDTHEDIQATASRLWPWLGNVKREQAYQALKAYNDSDSGNVRRRRKQRGDNDGTS